MIIRPFLAAAICFSAPSFADAKGGGGSHGGGTVHVSGYTLKDGTHVDAYDRAAPGTADHSGGAYQSAASMAGASGTSGGALAFGSSQGIEKPAAPVCEYKAVMSDDDIALCRQAAHRTH